MKPLEIKGARARLGYKQQYMADNLGMELSIFVQCLNPQNYAASANGCSRCLL